MPHNDNFLSKNSIDKTQPFPENEGDWNSFHFHSLVIHCVNLESASPSPFLDSNLSDSLQLHQSSCLCGFCLFIFYYRHMVALF